MLFLGSRKILLSSSFGEHLLSFGKLFIKTMWSGKAVNLCDPPLPFPVRTGHMTWTSYS